MNERHRAELWVSQSTEQTVDTTRWRDQCWGALDDEMSDVCSPAHDEAHDAFVSASTLAGSGGAGRGLREGAGGSLGEPSATPVGRLLAARLLLRGLLGGGMLLRGLLGGGTPG